MQTAAEIVQERTLKALYRDSERDSATQVITEGAEGCWYFIRCAPGRDLTAMNWLARRRFGVFLPMQGLKRVLPGWLCAYVWNIEAMQERILACPGVLGILKCHKHAPVALKPAFIISLAREAWTGKPLPHARPSSEKKKRKSKKDRRSLRKAKRDAKRAKLARKLDVSSQISALHHQ